MKDKYLFNTLFPSFDNSIFVIRLFGSRTCLGEESCDQLSRKTLPSAQPVKSKKRSSFIFE